MRTLATLLQRVLADGAWSIQRSGAGKVREDVLDADSSVWEKSKKFYAWTREHHGIALEYVLHCDDVCIFHCGHIGWLKHTLAVQKKGQGSMAVHEQDSGFREKALAKDATVEFLRVKFRKNKRLHPRHC